MADENSKKRGYNSDEEDGDEDSFVGPLPVENKQKKKRGIKIYPDACISAIIDTEC